MGVCAALSERCHWRAGLTRDVDEEAHSVRAVAERVVGALSVHRASTRRARRVRALLAHERWQELQEPQVIEPEVKGDEDLQVVHHHRARDEALVEQQALDVLREEVGGAHAERGEGLAARLRVGSVLHLVEQPQQRLRLDVEHRRRVSLSRDLVMALEEEMVEVLDRLLAGAIPRAVQGLVQVLRGAVVA